MFGKSTFTVENLINQCVASFKPSVSIDCADCEQILFPSKGTSITILLKFNSNKKSTI